MDAVTQLQEKLLECKKRLKALHVSQSNHTALEAIKLYFNNIQEYLNIINNNYSSHIEECNSHTTQIEDLQNQIDAINATLQNLPNLEDIDLSSINSELDSLKTKFETLDKTLLEHTADTETNLSLISNDISTIQTELGLLDEKATSSQLEIEDINNSIGAINTNISNLTTTQNNLSTTQSNLSSTVSGIDKRLSTAESNISALTGGIDVGELDSRITDLERATYGDYYSFKDYNYGFTPTNKTLYTREYYFSLAKNKPCKEILTLNYQSTGEGTLTIELYKNQELVLTKNYSLADNPETCEINYSHIPELMAQTTRLKIVSTTNITFNSLRLEIFGHNINFYKYDNDLKCSCFNNTIYITKYEDGIVKYGKFSVEDEIDLYNLPYSTNFYDDLCEGYTFKQFAPIPTTSSGYFAEQGDGFISEGIDNLYYRNVIEQPETTNISNTTLKTYGSGPLIYNRHGSAAGYKICNDKPCVYVPFSTLSLRTYDNLNLNSWQFITSVEYNKKKPGYGYQSTSNSTCIALNEDGNFYSVPHVSSSYPKVIGKGSFATAYSQDDFIINVYIFNKNKIDKYRLDKVSGYYSSTYLLSIEDCDCVYETYNNKIIKHTISTNTWSVEELEY